MIERPILFSGPMVRAIRDGSKTQTRRVMTLGRTGTFGHSGTNAYDFHFRGTRRGGTRGAGSGCWQDLRLAALLRLCPFGVPGDRLWGRETFALESSHEVGWYEPPHRDGRPLRVVEDDEGRWWEQPHYRATDPAPDLVVPGKDGPGVRWRPSIHMPRWASRIMLEVTNVRVQRLQDISEEDAIAEGVRLSDAAVVMRDGARVQSMEGTARGAFACLWDAINAKRGYGWDANPWVWAITFAEVAA